MTACPALTGETPPAPQSFERVPGPTPLSLDGHDSVLFLLNQSRRLCQESQKKERGGNWRLCALFPESSHTRGKAMLIFTLRRRREIRAL